MCTICKRTCTHIATLIHIHTLCDIQQYGDSFATGYAQPSQPQLKDLILIKILNWQEIGIQLKIDDYEIQKIHLEYKKVDECKREMFRTWLRTGVNPNYSDLIKALEAAGETKAAHDLQDTISHGQNKEPQKD